MDKPDVDFIEGLSPAISIDQKSASPQPALDRRHDHRGLRLPAPALRPHRRAALPERRHPPSPPDAAADRRPHPRSCPRAPASRCWPRWSGAARATTRRCSPTWPPRASPGPGSTASVELDESSSDTVELARYEQHTIEVVVDRLVTRDGIERRLTDSLETALRLADGVAEVQLVRPRRATRPTSETLTFSQHLACPTCGTSFEELAPRNFSFNSPYGACAHCDGLGTPFEVDPELVVPEPRPVASPRAPSRRGPAAHTQYFHRLLEAVAEDARHRPRRRRGAKLDRSSSKVLLYGVEPARCRCTYKNRYGRARQYYDASTRASSRACSAATPTPSPTGPREQIEGYMREVPCPACGGARLKPGVARPSPIDGKHIADAVRHVDRRRRPKFLAALELSERDRLIAERVVKEINARLGFLLDVGLDYLTLARSAATLAGGEAQRIRLATPDRLGPGRRAVRARRAVDRPAPARQPPPDRDPRAPARPRQHRPRRRARRGDDPRRRLRRRHRPRRRRARRRRSSTRAGQGHLLKVKASLTGQYLSGKRSIPVPAHAPHARRASG